MILYRKHPFKAEINYAYREINTWLKSEGFFECFKNNTNTSNEYHWYKDGVRIILHTKNTDTKFEKYIIIAASILHSEHNAILESCKYKYDDYDKILNCHKLFVSNARMLRNVES